MEHGVQARRGGSGSAQKIVKSEMLLDARRRGGIRVREEGWRVLHFHCVLFISPMHRCPAEHRPTEEPS